MLLYWCPKPAPSPRYLCKKLLLLKAPVRIFFHNKFQPGQYSLKYKKMSTNSACLIGKREERSCSSTNLGILSHESIIQIIAFIPASLRMRKTNHRDWERTQEDLGALIRQNVWEPKDRVIRQKGHECSLGRKGRCPQMCLHYSHGSDLIKQRASLVWLLDAVWVSLTAEGAGGQIWPGESSFQDHTPLFPPLPPLPCLPSQLT